MIGFYQRISGEMSTLAESGNSSREFLAFLFEGNAVSAMRNLSRLCDDSVLLGIRMI